MSLSFSNNIVAQRSILAFNNHLDKTGNSISKLSSGLRIKNAEDSPVDYAVSGIYRSEIQVIDQGIRNAQMGISTIQTAESGISDIHNLLVRIKELATQASTGTYTNSQRTIINSEISQLAMEIDRVAFSSNVSGNHLLDGSLSGENSERLSGNWFQNSNSFSDAEHEGMKLHYGQENRTEDYMFIKIGDLTTSGLFNGVGPDDLSTADKLDVRTQHGAQEALNYIQSAIDFKEISRANMGAIQNRLDFTINSFEEKKLNLQNAESNISSLDIAKEMAEFSSSQLLSQSATAMISQANILPQIAMKLLN